MNKCTASPEKTKTEARKVSKWLCLLVAAMLMQPSLVFARRKSDDSSQARPQVDFWTNVPEHWDSWEYIAFGRLHMNWNLDPSTKRVVVSYRGMGSMGLITRIEPHLESFDGKHLVLSVKYQGSRGVYEGDLNGNSVDGTVRWTPMNARRKWHAQWDARDNWPCQPGLASAGSESSRQQTQVPGGQTDKDSQGSVTAVAAVKHTVPRVHICEDDLELKTKYPEHYSFPLVSIQFPADYSDTFVDHISSLDHFHKETKDNLSKLVDEQCLKSTYFACQLYEYLKARLPAKSVLLVPCKLQKDGSGKVINFPMSKPIPAVIQLDTFSWVNIGRLKKPDAHLFEPDTFADKARTWVSMSMPIAGKRQVFAGQEITVPDLGKLYRSIETFYNVSPDAGYWKEFKASGRSPASHDRQYVDGGGFLNLAQDFRCRREDLSREATGTADDIEPSVKTQLRYYGNLIIDALNSQDLEKIEPVLLADYVDDMAPDLSQALSAPDKQANQLLAKQQRYFQHCLAAMREQLQSRESDSLAGTIYSGDFGQQFRTSVNAEMEYWKKAEATQKRQVLAAAALGVALGGVAGAAAIGASSAGLFTAMAAASGSVICREHKLENQLRSDFLKVWNDSHNAQVSCLVTLDNDTIEVRGDGAEAFRKSMKEGYEKRFGATAATTGAM